MPTICPYSGNEAEKFNDEHIFPDAIGGGLDYKLRVSEEANSQLGTSVDGPLLNSPLIQALRTEHGIRSRSGEPRWKLRGKIRDTGKEVEMTYERDKEMNVRIINPVTDTQENGGSGIITCSGNDLDKFLKNFIRGHEKKGHIVELGPEESLINQTVDIDLSIDIIAIKRALAKIAFAILIHYLLDYLNDPLVAEWRKLLFGTREEAMQTRIYGEAFDADKLLPYLFPKLESYQHAVTIARLDKPQILVGVTLFGLGFHHMIAVASDNNTYGLEPLVGRIAICDSRNSSTELIDYTDAFKGKKLGIYSP